MFLSRIFQKWVMLTILLMTPGIETTPNKIKADKTKRRGNPVEEETQRSSRRTSASPSTKSTAGTVKDPGKRSSSRVSRSSSMKSVNTCGESDDSDENGKTNKDDVYLTPRQASDKRKNDKRRQARQASRSSSKTIRQSSASKGSKPIIEVSPDTSNVQNSPVSRRGRPRTRSVTSVSQTEMDQRETSIPRDNDQESIDSSPAPSKGRGRPRKQSLTPVSTRKREQREASPTPTIIVDSEMGDDGFRMPITRNDTPSSSRCSSPRNTPDPTRRRGRPKKADLTPVSSRTIQSRETSPSARSNVSESDIDGEFNLESSSRPASRAGGRRNSVSSAISKLTLDTPPSVGRSKRPRSILSPSAYLDDLDDNDATELNITPAKKSKSTIDSEEWLPSRLRKRKRESNHVSHPSKDRMSLQRKRIRDKMKKPDPNHEFPMPKELPAFTLGDPWKCTFCWAIGWWTILICCANGQVFIDPQRAQPLCISKVFTSKEKKYKELRKQIIRLNCCLSFASTQTTFLQSKKGGVPVTKLQGAVHHFPSCALPFKKCDPVYGNLYLYEGDEANELRHKSYSDLDKKVLLDIQLFMEKYNYFAKYYKKMGDLIKEQERKFPGTKSSIRMKIVDAKRAEGLLGPHKIYRKIKGGEHLAVFFDAKLDQNVIAPGLIIYPRMGPNTMLPIFFWSDIVSPLCFPLLYPYAEYGYAYHKYKLAKGDDRKKGHLERLADYAEQHYKQAQMWELKISVQDLFRLTNRVPNQVQDNVGDSSDDSMDGIEEEAVEGRSTRSRGRSVENSVDGNDELLDENEQLEEDHASGIMYELAATIHQGEQPVPMEQDHVTFPANPPEVHPALQEEIAYPGQDTDEFDELLLPPTEFQRVDQIFVANKAEDDYKLGNTDVRPEIVEQMEMEIIVEEREDSEDDLLSEGTQINGIKYVEENDTEQLSEIGINQEEEPMEQDEMEADNESLSTREPTIGEADEMTEEGDIRPGDNMDPDLPEQSPEDDGLDDLFENGKKRGPQAFATRAQYANYVHQIREDRDNRFVLSGKLGQFELIDQCIRNMRNVQEYIKEKHGEFMTSTRTKFIDGFQKRMDQKNMKGKIGALLTVPSTVPGSPRWLREKFENAVALSNKLGKADLFITATTNTNWPELKKIIQPGRTFADYPYQTNQVFKVKLDGLMDLITGTNKTEGLWGPVNWHTLSIEFQQRGPPHAHIIVALVNKIKTADDLARVCQGEIPPQRGRLRTLVEEFMIHKPCEGDSKAYCREGSKVTGICTKGFPKKFSNMSRLDDVNYAQLYRPNNGEKSRHKADNRYVVPYNTQLLTFWEGHINVEVISSILVVKYIFKYVFKGVDRVLVEITTDGNSIDPGAMTVDGNLIVPKNLNLPKGALAMRKKEATELLQKMNVPLQDENGNPTLVYNEMWWTEDMRAMTACEAAWILAGYKRAQSSHTVVEIGVHLYQEEPIKYTKGTEKEVYQRLQSEDLVSRFNAWFALNREDPDARKYTLQEIPEIYRYDNGKWVRRKRYQPAIGKLKQVSPRNQELFAIRLLALNVAGPLSFQDLKTVDGIVYRTAMEAARALGFVNDQREWDFCLGEGNTYASPKALRRIFATILIHNTVTNPLELYTTHREEFFEKSKEKKWSEAKREAHSLYHIRSILKVHGKTLEDFRLPPVIDADLPLPSELADDSGLKSYPARRSAFEAHNLMKDMTEEQISVLETLVENVKKAINERKTYFLQGSGGTGKTRVLKALFHRLRADGFTVACVAHTGVAASLLPLGSTAHRQFHIPLTTEEDMRCSVAMESDEVNNIYKKIDCVIWDEATMTDRRIFEAVHKLFSEMYTSNANKIFGSIPFILAGDWKQTLPIVPELRGEGIWRYTAKNFSFWNEIQTLELTKNMRARNCPKWAEFLADLGTGKKNRDQHLPADDQIVKLPEECLRFNEDVVIHEVYGDPGTAEEKRAIFEKSAILAVRNETVREINKKVLELLSEEKVVYKSIDTFFENNKGLKDLPTESYNIEHPPGFPPHELELKIGAVVMLITNVSVPQGLTNGTRLVVTRLGCHLIECVPLNRERHHPKTPVNLMAMEFTPVDPKLRHYAFKRFQFPIRLGFTMTCNKAQGQTIKRCGLILKTPCFGHGQLYVALSRVEDPANLWIYNAVKNRDMKDYTCNVVYRKIIACDPIEPVQIDRTRKQPTLFDFVVEPESSSDSSDDGGDIDEMGPINLRTIHELETGTNENAGTKQTGEEPEVGPRLFIERFVANMSADVVVNVIKPDLSFDLDANEALIEACAANNDTENKDQKPKEQQLMEKINEHKQKFHQLEIGQVITTDGYLEGVKTIFHMVTPVQRRKQPTLDDEKLLKNCYKNCLRQMIFNRFSTIAFPIPENYEFQQAAVAAMLAVLEYLGENPISQKRIKEIWFYSEHLAEINTMKTNIGGSDEELLTPKNIRILKKQLEDRRREIIREIKRQNLELPSEDDIPFYAEPENDFPKLRIIRNQIQKITADAIVNAANKELRPGGGVDGAIRTACGLEKINEATKKIADSLRFKILQPGQVVCTDSFDLKTAKQIYHTAGPIIPEGTRPTLDHKAHLEKCYLNSLAQAETDGFKSIAFPLLSVGIYNYDLFQGICVALWSIFRHFEKNPKSKIKEVIIVNNSERIVDKIANIIADTTKVLNPAKIERFRKAMEKIMKESIVLRMSLKPQKILSVPTRVVPPPIYKRKYNQTLNVNNYPNVAVALELLNTIWRNEILNDKNTNNIFEALEEIFNGHFKPFDLSDSMLLQIMPASDNELPVDYLFRMLRALPSQYSEQFQIGEKIWNQCLLCQKRTPSYTESLCPITITEVRGTFQTTFNRATSWRTYSSRHCCLGSPMTSASHHDHYAVASEMSKYLAVQVDFPPNEITDYPPHILTLGKAQSSSWKLFAIIRPREKKMSDYDICTIRTDNNRWQCTYRNKSHSFGLNSPCLTNKSLLIFQRINEKE